MHSLPAKSLCIGTQNFLSVSPILDLVSPSEDPLPRTVSPAARNLIGPKSALSPLYWPAMNAAYLHGKTLSPCWSPLTMGLKPRSAPSYCASLVPTREIPV